MTTEILLHCDAPGCPAVVERDDPAARFWWVASMSWCRRDQPTATDRNEIDGCSREHLVAAIGHAIKQRSPKP